MSTGNKTPLSKCENHRRFWGSFVALCVGSLCPCGTLWCHCCVQLLPSLQGSLWTNPAPQGSPSLCFPGTFWATHYLFAGWLLNAFKLYLQFLIKTCLHWCFKLFCWRCCPLCVKHRVNEQLCFCIEPSLFFWFKTRIDSFWSRTWSYF